MSVVSAAGAPAPRPAPTAPPFFVDGQPPHYVGLATRVIAFALDSAIINVAAVVVDLGTVLLVSVVHLSKTAKTVFAVFGGVVYILWVAGYFAWFWATTGQTPGNRVMQIRVVTAKGSGLGPRRALIRFGGLILAALPLFSGFLLILFDRRRRGLQDRIANTVVVEAPDISIAAARRKQLRQAQRDATDAGRSPDPGDAPRPADRQS